MSTPETTTPPPTDAPGTTPDMTTPTQGNSKWFAVGGAVMAVIGILFSLYFFAFHLGAAVLSYQKFGSFLWAILDFFFPYFYYPYYAFVASKQETAPVESTGMAGGAKKAMGLLRKMRATRFRRL